MDYPIYNEALPPLKEPFEGDDHIGNLISQMLGGWTPDLVVETGTQTGATAVWLAISVAATRCPVFTCDIRDQWDSRFAVPRNLIRIIGDSPKVIEQILNTAEIFICPNEQGLDAFFYLDAHNCPEQTALLDELRVLAEHNDCFRRLIIAIHDFQVDAHPELGYDTYNTIGALNVTLVQPYMDVIYGEGSWICHCNTMAVGAQRGIGFFFKRV